MTSIVRRSAIAVAVVGVALTFAGVALAVKSGDWDGITNQTAVNGYAMPFSFQLSHNKITVIFYGANYTGNSPRCANSDSQDAQRLDPNTGFRGFTIKHNKFGGRVTEGGTEHIALSGKFSGRSVSGSFTDSYTVGAIRCSTGKVRFEAKPGNALI